MARPSTRSQRPTPSGATSKTDAERARRARKRDTDRQAQRHHRERHRAYVRKLEEMVDSYKQSCSHSGNPDVAALMADNESLRERCHKLESLLSRINNLSGGPELPDSTGAACSSPSRGGDQHDGAGGGLEHLSSATSTTTPFSNERQSGMPEVTKSTPRNGAEPRVTSTIEAVPSTPASVAEHPFDTDFAPNSLADCRRRTAYTNAVTLDISKDRDNCFDIGGPSEKVTTDTSQTDVSNSGYYSTQLGNMGHTGGPNVATELELEPYMRSMLEDTMLDLELTEQQHQSYLPALSVSPCSVAFSAEHQIFPMTTATCTWDRLLLGIIDEAKTQHATGLYPTQKPTLHSVLSNRSSDILAYRLYHFICGYGPMPLHNLLAIFWVQYLALRWYVIGTQAAYLQVPDFMRPTDLERRIPHSVSIGMLVWPDVRRTLIRDALTADTEATGTSLLRHLSTNWSPMDSSGDLIGRTDVLSIIERQACNIDAWRISRKFGELHPQFAHCQLSHYD